MFERFTELARRAIFFARYEASAYGSAYIESEHMLLGLLHENSPLRRRLAWSAILKDIDQRAPRGAKIATSVDIPVSNDVKKAFACASQEADALGQQHIDLGHLLIGLIEVKECLAAKVLEERGVGEALVRAFLCEVPDPAPAEPDLAAPLFPIAPFLAEHIHRLRNLIEQASYYMEVNNERYGEQRLKRKNWSRKEAVGHLIDCATAHHQWFVSALTEPSIHVNGYPPDDWVGAQRYTDASWPELLTLWIGLNEHLVRVLAQIPEEKRSTPVRIGVLPPISLEELIRRYVEHCVDLAGQLLARL